MRLLALAIVLCLAPGAFAQEDGATALTLEETVRLARETSPTAAAAMARLEAIREEMARERSRYLPHLRARGRYTRNDEDVRFFVALPGAVPEEVLLVRRNELLGEVAVEQKVLDAAAILAMRRAAAAAQLAETEREQAVRDVVFAAAEVYFTTAGLQEGVESARRTVELRAVQVSDARVKMEAGAGPRQALLQAEIARVRADQELVRAMESLEASRRALGIATGLGLSAPRAVVPPAPAAPSSIPLPDLVAAAARERLEIRRAAQAVTLAEREEGEAWAKLVPTLGISGLALVTNAGGFRGNYWQLSLLLDVPILEGGLRLLDIRAAQARVREAKAREEETRRAVAEEVARARSELAALHEAYLRAVREVDLAEENARVAKLSYDAGASTWLEYQTAANALELARLVKVTRTIDAHVAALKLLRALGRGPLAPIP